MVKMKCKTTGAAVTVQPSLAEKGYWLITYQTKAQYIHTHEEIRAHYVF